MPTLSRRSLVATALLATSLLASGLTAGHAAAANACRADPVVTLSNGKLLHVGVIIYDDVSDIQSIHYQLQIPFGVSVVSVAYPLNNPLTPLEHLDVDASGPRGVYSTWTLVKTGTPQVGVSAYTSISDQGIYWTPGYSGTPIFTTSIDFSAIGVPAVTTTGTPATA